MLTAAAKHKIRAPRRPTINHTSPSRFCFDYTFVSSLLGVSDTAFTSQRFPHHLPPLPSALLGLALTPSELCCQKKCQPLSLSKRFPAPNTEQGRSVIQGKTSHIIFSNSMPLLCIQGGTTLVPVSGHALGAAWVTCSTSLPFPEPAQV